MKESSPSNDRLLLNIIFPLLIFVGCVGFVNVFLMRIFPQNLAFMYWGNDYDHYLLPTAFGISLGVFAVTLYYFDWRRYMGLSGDRLAIKLLYMSIAWVIHHLIIIVPSIMGYDSLISNARSHDIHPTILEYILFLVALYYWGLFNMRMGRYIENTTPVFIRTIVRFSQIYYVLVFIPTLLWIGFTFFLMITCGCG